MLSITITKATRVVRQLENHLYARAVAVDKLGGNECVVGQNSAKDTEGLKFLEKLDALRLLCVNVDVENRPSTSMVWVGMTM